VYSRPTRWMSFKKLALAVTSWIRSTHWSTSKKRYGVQDSPPPSFLTPRLRDPLLKGHRQFNMTIDTELILGVKFLAAILQFPRYIITERLLKMRGLPRIPGITGPGKASGVREAPY